MIVAEGAGRLAELADLHGRVWGERPSEEELAWLYERNPVAPASVLLAEEDGAVVGSATMTFLRMSVGGEEVLAGMPVHLATDSAFRGRGIFTELEAASEERARAAGARLLFVVPTPASASVLRGRLGWTALPSLRVWARVRAFRARRSGRVRSVARLDPQVTTCYLRGSGDRVLRDASWVDWRFADGPRRYALLEGDGYAAVGTRGRAAIVAALAGDLLGDAAAVADRRAIVAAPPPWERRRYALAGYVPTPKAFALLGKSLDPALPLPARPHFELGDLDFA
jgi:predicted N-acetyltransferase YhbS